MSDTPPPPGSIDDYLTLIRAGLVEPEVLAELDRRLEGNPEAVREYIRLMHFQASLHWLLEGQVPGDDAVRGEVRRVIRRHRRKVFWQTTVASLALSLMAVFGYLRYLERTTHDLPVNRVVGYLEKGQGLDWGEGAAVRLPLLLREFGRYRMQHGVVSIRMDRGAEVLIEGPAEWTVPHGNQLTLETGRLTADVPPRAVGFTVAAGAVRAVDLGTRFVISTTAGQAAEVHVFDGEVRAQGAETAASLLTKDRGLRFSWDGLSQTALAANPETFLACLQYRAGVLDLTGNARFSPHPLTQLSRPGAVSAGVIHWFHERQRFVLPADVPVVSTALSVLDTATTADRSVLPAGTVVDSFFAHFVAVGEGYVRCRIEFDRPVLGFVLEPRALDEADRLFGGPGVRYLPPIGERTNRGSVLRPQGPPSHPGAAAKDDRLELSPDRRAISLFLHTSPEDLDQLRILVAPQEPTPFRQAANPAAVEEPR